MVCNLKDPIVRLAQTDDLPYLASIEKSAFIKFKMYLDFKQEGQTLPLESLQKSLSENLLWIITEKNIRFGFLAAQILDDNPHIEEFSIAFEYQGKGYGKIFISKFLEWAKSESYSFISLTTDRLIPWNAPFYSKFGFTEISMEDCKPGLRVMLQRDKAKSLSPETRIAMTINI